MSVLGILGGIGAGVASAAPSIMSTLADMRNTDKTNQTNKDIANSNIDYQKAFNEQVFAREDSAYQRTVNDMRLAGLNPLSMGSTNGAGGSANAPQSSFQAVKPDVSALGDVGSRFLETLNAVQAAQYNKAQVDNINSVTKVNNATAGAQIATAKATALNAVYDSLDKGRKEYFNRYFNINDGMTDDERKAAIFSRLITGEDGDIFSKNPENSVNAVIKNDGSVDFKATANPDGSNTDYDNFAGTSAVTYGIDKLSTFLKDFTDLKNLFKPKLFKGDKK